jgi:carboxyl-terminal processing protease
LVALQKSEENQLNKNQSEIKELLQEELIKRYQYKEGLYDFYIKNNSEVKKAISLLNNPADYGKILKN